MENIENVELRIEKLRGLILYHDNKYFNEQDSEISDFEYDQLFYELRELEKQYPEFQDPDSPTNRVGGSIENALTKVQHETPMLSLGKCKNWVEFEKWFLKIINQVKKFVFEIKLDGLAVSLIYNQGKLIKGVTRGTGSIGEDITTSLLMVPNIPKHIDDQGLMEVRGEIILLKTGLEAINKIRIQNGDKPYDNVRNSASGITRTKTPIKEFTQYLRFGAYMFTQGDGKTDSHSGDMEYLNKLGFTVVNDLIPGFSIKINDVDEDLILIKDKFNDLYEERVNLDFDIDGIVIKADLYSDQEKLGQKSREPNWATAYKFEAERVMTQLLGLEHLLGAKGNITPRSILKPVRVSGSTVTKPTLHNYDIIKHLDLKIGDYVWVERRGDVIPKIVGVVKELRTGSEKDIILPTNCPECNSVLTWKKVIPRCDNKDCSGGQMFRVQNYIKALEIKEFGSSLIEKLFDAGLVSDLTDIYNLTKEDIADLERMGERLAEKILNNVEKSKSASLWRIIAGLTIKNVGESSGKELANKYQTLEGFTKCTKEELVSIEGFGEVVTDNIINWLNDDRNIILINKLIKLGIGQNNNSEVIVSENKLNGAKIGFTGELSISRKKVEELIKQNGGVTISIKKGIMFLLIGNGAKDHKIEHARELGAKIIEEDEFLKMLE